MLGVGAAVLLLAGLCLAEAPPAQASWLAQQPTVAVPTVTGTPAGPMVVVNQDQHMINVRAGPGFDYPEVGILVQGQRVPAYGASPGQEWIQIGYAGIPGGIAWVHAALVTVEKLDRVPLVTPPPTPTLRVTATLDPTLAARYLVEASPTRLPTYTPAPPVLVPTFALQPEGGPTRSLPVGLLIVGLAVIGLFGMMLSFLRGR